MAKDYLFIVILIAIVLYGLEYYFTRKKGLNRWIIPLVTWGISLIVAIPFSLAAGLFASMLQLMCLAVFTIEDHLNKNKDTDKIKIKNL